MTVGMVTLTEVVNGTLKEIIFAWTSDASGNVSWPTQFAYAGSPLNVQFAPGSPTPTNLYDVTLTDASSVDVLTGNGANLSSAASVFLGASSLTDITGSSILTLTIANAGASKQGTITVFVSGTTDAYCSLAQVKNRLSSQSLATDTVDDSVINDMISEASRAIDNYCNRWFYANTQTRYYSVPDCFGSNSANELLLDEDLLSITTLTNGNGDVISSTDYNLLPRNEGPKNSILLIPTSNVRWQTATSGNPEFVISVLGTWGYIDRTATDPLTLRRIALTEQATIEIVLDAYKARYGTVPQGAVTVTAAGLVITPQSFSPRVISLLGPLVKHSFA